MNKHYVWSKERDLGVRYARNPQDDPSLSGTVLLYRNGISAAHVKFTKETIRKLGRVMPYGIGPENPAYLKAVYTPKGYEIWCCYFDGTKSILLWVSTNLPDWIKNPLTGTNFPTKAQRQQTWETSLVKLKKESTPDSPVINGNTVVLTLSIFDEALPHKKQTKGFGFPSFTFMLTFGLT